MRSVDALDIDLRELSDGVNTFEYALDDAFFEAVDATDIHGGELKLKVTIKKVEDFFNVVYHVEGAVNIPCDRCLDDMAQPISADNRLLVRYGSENSDDEDIVYVAEDEGILSLAWFVYETVVLAIPIQHFHAEGECNPEMTRLLAEYAGSAPSRSEENEKPVDERWSKLAGLFEDNQNN